MLLGRQRQVLAMQVARATEERVRVLADAPPPVSFPGEQGGAGSASLVELPTLEPPRSETLPTPTDNKVGSAVVGDDRPEAVPTIEAAVEAAPRTEAVLVAKRNRAEAALRAAKIELGLLRKTTKRARPLSWN